MTSNPPFQFPKSMEDSKEKSILYLIFEEIKPKEGISKKILAQVKAFEEHGYKCELGRFVENSNGSCDYQIGDEVISSYQKDIVGKFSKRYNYKGLKKYIRKYYRNFDFVYIRYTKFANFSIISLFRFISKRLPIYLEIPTFPYDGELKLPLKKRYKIWEEKIFRKYMATYVKKIVTYSYDKLIFGRPTLKINNSIDPTVVPIRNVPNNPNEFNLIGVADLSFWHGYDRVIEGIKLFVSIHQNPMIKFHIVGSNPGREEYDRLNQLVKSYNLEKFVIFYGTKSGKELDELFNLADIAIGCLGCHRKGIDQVQSLKNVEYANRGIPFIYSEINENFDNKKYVYKVPPDDSPIDIEKLITYANSVNLTPEEIRYSVLDFTWINQMRKIILDNSQIN